MGDFMKKLPALLNTPARAVMAVGLIVLVSEYLIMALFDVIHGVSPTRDDYQLVMIFNYLDPILLIAIVSPALYILIFRPMRDQQDELEVARRKIEQAHREWMAALDVVDDPIFLHDKNFRILRCNKAYQQCAGIPLHEIIGQPYYEIFPKNHAPMPCCLRAMEEAEEAEEVVLASGSSYRSRAFSVHDEQGTYLYSVHTLEDITERKHQEERTAALLELSTSVETLDEKTLLQQGLDTVQHLTDSRIGFLHFVSEDQKEIELVTWSTDTLAHYCQAAFDRHYPLSAAGIWVDSVLLKQPVIINDYAAAPGKKGLPEGHAAVQRFICMPVLEGTQVRMIVGVGNAASDYDEHDVETVKLFSYDLYRIAQRKRAIKSLEESAQHFRAIAQSANDAIISADSASNIVGWNTAAERLFGYTEAEIIGQPLTVLMPERFRNLHREGLARVVAGGAPHVIGKTVELAGLHKDGSEFPLEFSLAQWQAADGQFFTAIIRDITEHKQADSHLPSSSMNCAAGTSLHQVVRGASLTSSMK